MKIQIKNTSNNPLPAYEVKGSAGMDLRADFSEINTVDDITRYGFEHSPNYNVFVKDYITGKKKITIYPSQRTLIPTGIHIALPEGYEAQIRPRSGLALRKGIMVCNSPGTVDNGFLDEIKVILLNTSNEPFEICDGDRIAQMVINKIETAEWEEVDELTGYNRGGGFGHSGTK